MYPVYIFLLCVSCVRFEPAPTCIDKDAVRKPKKIESVWISDTGPLPCTDPNYKSVPKWS